MNGGPELIGFMAATFATVSFVPQVWKTWRGGSTRDISLAMYSLFSLGVALWLLYGILLRSAPLIVSNAITLVLALTVLGLKLRNGRQ